MKNIPSHLVSSGHPCPTAARRAPPRWGAATRATPEDARRADEAGRPPARARVREVYDDQHDLFSPDAPGAEGDEGARFFVRVTFLPSPPDDPTQH